MQGSLVNNGMVDGSTLSDSALFALDELKFNGPLHLDSIPKTFCPRIGFTHDDIEILIRKKLAVRISVKGNRSFVAAVEP